MRTVPLVFLLAVPASADWFAVGLRGGAPLTDIFDTSSRAFTLDTSTTRFTIGPSAELLLPLGLGLEVDALYKRSSLEATPKPPAEGPTVTRNEGSWEFPLLAKYRLPGDALRPYLAAGASFRSLGELTGFLQSLDASGWGFVLSGGLELKIGGLRFSPELRYTRWGSGQTGPTQVRYSGNQVDFLIGFTF